MPQVTQADREAAGKLAREVGDDWIAGPILAGMRDQYAWVQAFAAHRKAERDRIVAWLRGEAGTWTALRPWVADDLATAIEKGAHHG